MLEVRLKVMISDWYRASTEFIPQNVRIWLESLSYTDFTPYLLEGGGPVFGIFVILNAETIESMRNSIVNYFYLKKYKFFSLNTQNFVFRIF